MRKINTVDLITTYPAQNNWKETRQEILDNSNDFDVNSMCDICIKRQKDLHGQITIPCSGLATLRTSLEAEIGEEISPELYSELLGAVGSDALRLGEESENSYTWITNNIADPDIFKPRPYQNLINSCLVGSTQVSMADGSFKNIRDVVEGDYVFSFQKSEERFRTSKVTIFFNQGIKQVYRVNLGNGDNLTCTEDHLILTRCEDSLATTPPLKYMSIKDGLKPDMNVCIADALPNCNKTILKQVKVVSIEVLGEEQVYDIEVEGDHNFVANNIIVHNCTAKMKVLRMGRRCVSEDTKVRGLKKDISIKHLYHKFKHHKKLPEIEAYDEQTGEIVLTNKYVIIPNGYKDTITITLSNGHSLTGTHSHPVLVYTDKHYHFEDMANVEIGTSLLLSEDTLVEVTNISYGKDITYHLSVVKYETFITAGGIINHNTGKTISMAIGILHRLVTRSDYKVLMVAPMVTMIDEVVEQIKKYCKELRVNPITKASSTPINLLEFTSGSSFKGVSAGASGAKGARGKAADLLYMDECFPAGTRIKLIDGSTKSIEDIEEGDYVLSYDKEINKLVSKKVLTSKPTGYKDVYEYKTVSGKKLIATENHPVLSDNRWISIKDAKTLATISTKTGLYFNETIVETRYKGIARVYNFEVEDTHTYIANDFIVHNCDFLTVKDLNSLLAIINDNPDVEVWASSTPIGEGNLYRLGTDPMFKEFHYPSFVTDHYNEQTDQFNRRNLTTIAYEQEVLANYGASEESVFQIKFVDQSVYEDDEVLINWNHVRKPENRRNFIVTLGVDWNRDKVGTRLVVVAFDKLTNRYHTIHKDRVALLGWTQLAAINKIVETNEKYDIDHIYVDDGHGETQASFLRMYGQKCLVEKGPKDPGAKLVDTKAVMFGASLTLRDPVTNEEIKKQTKQYMVDHTVTLLGRGNLVLKSEEDNDIVMQLKNYTVKSVSVRGLKTYTAKDKQVGDHDLDAYMLALHAINQEYSELAGNVPTGAIVELFRNHLTEGSVDNSDELATLGFSSNIIINTRRTMAESAFRSSRTKGFRPRRKW